MKHLVWLGVLCAGLVGGLPARAQVAAGDAARQEFEDRLRRLERDLEAMKEANEILRRKLTTLENGLNEVSRTAVERANSSNNILKLTASKDELAQLEQALKQSEQHREADKKWFIEQLKELGKVIATPPAPPTSVGPKTNKSKSEGTTDKGKSPSPGGPDTGVYHVVEKNQTASEILKAYNDDLKAKGRTTKISMKQLEAANPHVDMNKVRAGQKLFIPIPEK